jgi:Flp pilus assembly protein TadG
VSGFVVSLFLGLMAMAGLVFDGSRLVAARAEIDDHAANAARAAAQEIVDVRLGQERIDPQAGSAAARGYLAAHGLDGTVQIDGLRVRVTVVDTVPMTLLALVGVDERVVATTRVVEMIDE